jgi:hypothetical protein
LFEIIVLNEIKLTGYLFKFHSMRTKIIVFIFSFFAFHTSLFSQSSMLKSIQIDNIMCSDLYESGKTQTLSFSFTANSVDFEYVNSVSLVFPVGYIVNNASSTIGKAVLNPINGTNVTWGSDTISYGGITTDGSSYNFTVNVTIPQIVMGNQAIQYYFSGDLYGGLPHNQSGIILIKSKSCSNNQVPITVTVKTDKYPEETSWYLTNTSETNTYLSDAYFPDSSTVYSKNVCINSLDTVKFVIKDEFGDGICCVNGDGYYSITTPCGIIKQGAMFNDEEDTTFVVQFSGKTDYNFEKTDLGLKNDEGISIIQTCDGSLLMAANNENQSRGGYDVSLVNITPMGDIKWEKKIGSKMNEVVSQMIETSDGGYLITGYKYPQDLAYVRGMVVKTTSKGDTVWTKYFGSATNNSNTYCMSSLEINNHYLVAGKRGDSLLVFYLDNNGKTVNSYEYYGSTKIGSGFPQLSNYKNTCLISFNYDSIATIGIKQIRSNGQFIKDLTLPTNDFSFSGIKKVFTLSENRILLAGWSTNNNNYWKQQTVILDSNLSVIKTIYNDNSADVDERIIDVTVLPNNSMVVLGIKSYWNYDTEAWDSTFMYLTKCNSSGNIEWERPYLHSYTTIYPSDIIMTADSGFAITGTYNDSRNKENMFLLRTNPQGIVNEVYQHETICMVTVDPMTGKNLITWEKTPGAGTVSFNVYKETNIAGNYDFLGSVPFDSVSAYVDTYSNPIVRADRYKITCVNSFGLESRQSENHKTMHLNINKGLGNSYNLIWDNYEGFPFNTYNVYRGTASDNMMLIASLPSNLTSFTDLQTPANSNIYYQVAVVKSDPCIPNSRLKSDSGPFSQSLSNMAESELTASPIEHPQKSFSVFPNPAQSFVTVQANDNDTKVVDVLIYNEEGKKVLETTIETPSKLDLKTLVSGVYLVEIHSNKSIVREKLVVKK